jgi:hypothetical protein
MEITMRKIRFGAALAILACCATFAFATTSFIAGPMTATGVASAPASGTCSSPAYATICAAGPCSCLQVPNAAVSGKDIGKGKANLSFTEDAGDGDGSHGAITKSNCVPVFGGGTFIDSKTAASAVLNIQGTLCGGHNFSGGYTVVSGGTAWGTVTGSLARSTKLTFSPQ